MCDVPLPYYVCLFIYVWVSLYTCDIGSNFFRVPSGTMTTSIGHAHKWQPHPLEAPLTTPIDIIIFIVLVQQACLTVE